MHPMLNIGVRAAHLAGDFIVRSIERLQGMEITSKGLNDYVTEVDNGAENIIIDTIRKAYPEHAVLAEESGAQGDSEYQWIIDPLDGTTNYVHGFPQYAVSIALQRNDRLQQAVVYDPLRQETFTASRGAGAYLDNRRIRVSKCRQLKTALIGTGFPFRDMQHLDSYLKELGRVFASTAGVRRAGSAALDLCYVACGRLDGFWEYGLKPWDIAAGILLIKEAGGFVNDEQNDLLQHGNIVAGSDIVYRELGALLSEHMVTA